MRAKTADYRQENCSQTTSKQLASVVPSWGSEMLACGDSAMVVGLYKMASKPRCGRGWTGGVLGGGMSGGGISGGKTFKIKDRPSRHEKFSSK